ncbi:MAG TPA: tRNA (adenosine(37)-N6)-dimethylallyltransferase MiaA [Phycisphaerae bacterium]|nr:tRNA (adenosine(37)-N6)-dimethylallyltransferase MiaA [Phycisphaerae bacterium]
MPKPIVILGCTAAGKSDLAEALALRLHAELLAVDSMQVYRGMDIGTAKPTPETRAQVPYLMLDVCDPWEVFSAAKFVEAARPLVQDRIRAGKPLIIVAGTILYLRALIEGLFEGPSADENLRAELNARAAAQGTAPLHAELAKIDPTAAARIHPNDQRRIIRALEVFRLTGTPISTLQTQWSAAHPAIDATYIGIQRDKESLNRRINTRVKKMLEAGLIDEVRRLANDPRGFSSEAASAVGYRQLLDQFAGKHSLEEAIELIKIQTRYLAKMQRTWMKRWPPPGTVKWLPAAEHQEGADLMEQITL